MVVLHDLPCMHMGIEMSDLVDEQISAEPFAELLGERYLAYALSTITQRALPDVRDGMKPVHRRILHAMRELKLNPDSHFKRSSRVVGDVIGKFHPHGESAVYDALVRLAQDFSSRYPLVEGQGNFGNVDGDSAAAPRYTEARLTAVALALLRDIENETVEFRDNYDGTEREPVVLPAAFPNLLANGSNGIAVGMATSIPPHNAEELCLALKALVKDPALSDEKLVGFVSGPDLPTGGILVESAENIAEAYATGRGGFRVRARWEKEDLGRGTYQIIITEIPYQVQKSRLIEQLADIVTGKKNHALGDVRDESAEDIRIVLEPRNRSIEPDALMEILFRDTELESRISLNLNVLDADGHPRVHSLKQALNGFIAHRRQVVLRRTTYRLGRIADRLEILEGLRLVYLDLDEVIRIIRQEDEPKLALIERFRLTDRQAEAILDTRLRSLRKLEEEKMVAEIAKLEAERLDLEEIVADSSRLDRVLTQEFDETIDAFGKSTNLGRRRTSFQDAPVVNLEEVLRSAQSSDPVTIVLSQQGWVRLFKGHLDGQADVKFKEGDGLDLMRQARSNDRLVAISQQGRAFIIDADQLPAGRGFGEPLRLLLNMAADDDLAGLLVFQEGARMLLASADGRGFVTPMESCITRNRSGKQLMNVGADSQVRYIGLVQGDHVAVIGENRKLLAFPLAELPELEKGRGVILQRYKDGGLSDVCCFNLSDGLFWIDGSGRRQQVSGLETYLGKRASVGRNVPRGFNRSGKFDDRPS